MMDELSENIEQLMEGFNQQIAQFLPTLTVEVETIIVEKNQNENEIEHLLDTLLSLTQHGLADDLYVQLLEYYKTVSRDGAEFYWKAYDEQD